ncbi:MAG: CRTAC1 family protein, partial [Candidatus Promineifilaceae bacterium]
NGDGTFTNVAQLLGSKTVGAGFVATFVDFDNDGDLDIYLVNDEFINPIGNILWRNDGAGCDGWCFTEISKASGTNVYLMGMGLASADFDRDGFVDFHFSNAGPMQLLRNQGDGTFSNVAPDAGVEFSEGIGWGTVFLDYDNDGWQDLYVAIMDGADGSHPGNPLFHNTGNGTFDLIPASGARDFGRSLGVAAADYNRDGAVDLLVGNIDDGYHLFTNNGNNNRWLALKLVGDGQQINRDAIGSRVYVELNDGAILMQDVTAGGSLGAGHSLILNFGLGESDVAQLEIVWPDGTRWHTNQAPHNQLHTISYGLENESALKPYEPPTLFGLALDNVIGSAIGFGLLIILSIPFINAFLNRNKRTTS